MKRRIVVLVLVMCLGVSIGYAKEFKQEKFEVTFKITFNAVDLSEAYRLEKEIKKRYDNACSIDTIVKEAEKVIYTLPSYMDEGLFVNDDLGGTIEWIDATGEITLE